MPVTTRRASTTTRRPSKEKRDVSFSHTCVRDSPGKGKGLFASKPIAKGDIVARMRHTHTADTALRSRHAKAQPGGDAAIAVGKEVYTSTGFGTLSRDGTYLRAPRWYRMNHGDHPNTRAEYVGGLGIVWRALSDVPKTRELVWHYGQRDPAWPRS